MIEWSSSLRLCLVLNGTKQKNIKKNDFFMYDFNMKNMRANET